MALELQGVYYLRVVINGVELNLSPSSIQDLLIIENNLQALPTLTLQYQDRSETSSNLDLLVDGAIIEIQFGKDKEKQEIPNLKFRILGQPQHRYANGGIIYRINAILNAPLWLHSMATKPFTGTSSAAISYIASQCGLKALCDPTADSQVWYPNRLNYNKWADKISLHGWADNLSCMVLGVDAEGLVYYRNLSTYAFGSPKARFNEGSTDNNSTVKRHIIRDYQVISGSTLYNHTAGYQVKHHRIGVDGVISEQDQLSVKRVSRTTINSEDSKKIGFTRTPYTAPNTGNIHSKYELAEYQNKRIRSTWSTDIHVIVDEQTDLRLFDPVDIYLPQYRGDYDRFSGRYIVGARVRYLRAGRYGEKFELVSQGPQTGEVLS